MNKTKLMETINQYSCSLPEYIPINNVSELINILTDTISNESFSDESVDICEASEFSLTFLQLMVDSLSSLMNKRRKGKIVYLLAEELPDGTIKDVFNIDYSYRGDHKLVQVYSVGPVDSNILFTDAPKYCRTKIVAEAWAENNNVVLVNAHD